MEETPLLYSARYVIFETNEMWFGPDWLVRCYGHNSCQWKFKEELLARGSRYRDENSLQCVSADLVRFISETERGELMRRAERLMLEHAKKYK